MTRQRKQLIAVAAISVMVGVGLVFAGVPASTLLLIGFVLAMVFMHAGGHGGHGGQGARSEPSGHQQPSGTQDRSRSQDP